jgi:hypothetical protein
MAIDVTKVKRTRGGHEVRIYATDGKGLYPIHGAYCNGDWWESQTWTSDGKVQCGPEGPYDLIEEPRTVEVDVGERIPMRQRRGMGHARRSRPSRDNRIACINIKRTVTEGEGL